MEATGFVLAGGASVRMGRDKALLPYRGTTLVEYIAFIVRQAAGAVIIIGDPDRYRHIPYPACPDQIPGCGPIGGIYTALSVTMVDWNVVVACDMPRVSVPVLRGLIGRAVNSSSQCVVGAGPDGEPQPLCGVYHRKCLPVVERSIRDKRFRMRELVLEMDAEYVPLDLGVLANINTPGDWVGLEDRPA
jgi:molybdopterin-guanine dinucleotide biosynthesis protein A